MATVLINVPFKFHRFETQNVTNNSLICKDDIYDRKDEIKRWGKSFNKYFSLIKFAIKGFVVEL